MLRIVGLSVLVSGGLILAEGQAQAAGCNGHVNQMEWGCAPWDNNNGPQFPHYVAPKKPAAPAHVTPQPPHLIEAPKPLNPGGSGGSGFIGHDTANGGYFIGHDTANGGYAKAPNASGIVTDQGAGLKGNR